MPLVDGVIGVVAHTDSSAPKTSSKYKSTTVVAPCTPSSKYKNPSKTSEVNVFQYTAVEKASKVKGKGIQI